MLSKKFIKIRRSLNMTQGEMENQSGISRPTIIKIEKGVSRLSKTTALALFMVVAYHLEKLNDSVGAAEWSELKKEILFYFTLSNFDIIEFVEKIQNGALNEIEDIDTDRALDVLEKKIACTEKQMDKINKGLDDLSKSIKYYELNPAK